MKKLSKIFSGYLVSVIIISSSLFAEESRTALPKLSSENMGETLYNGIVLPEVWPPRNMDPHSDDPMPVPYLESPPAIIPVDLGRQLFVDDFLIETTDLARTYHNATKYEGNPVLKPETQEELRYPSVGFLQGGVFYNPEKQLFEMFYHSGHVLARSLHLATSKDLVRWERPDLGLGRGNMFLPAGGWTGPKKTTAGTAFAVWLDLSAQDPAERYKLLSYLGHWRPKPPGALRFSLHTSPDGIRWSDATLAGEAEDAQSLFYNPFREVWVYSIKRSVYREGRVKRARWYYENKDFLSGRSWDDAVYWTFADRLDKPEPANGYPAYPQSGDRCQLYGLNAVAYESIMIGMHGIHRGPENDICAEGSFPKLTDLELGFSRDGFHWSRPDRTGFIRATREEGSWDRGYLHSTTSVCLVLDDHLVFPYAGYSGVAWYGERGMYLGGSIGIATLRRDGFASMDADINGGSIITRPIHFSGKHLFVNVDAPEGELRAELLDVDGDPITPFTAENCIPVSLDETQVQVSWRGTEDLAALSGKPVRIRFSLRNGSLYSFWISKDATGKSGGYLGGGGPGYNFVRDE